MAWVKNSVQCFDLFVDSVEECDSCSVSLAGAPRSASKPPNTPVTKAATILKMANGQPKKEALTKIESTPVCGVLMRNPTAAPSLAPSFLSPMPAGITPQEQSGNGIPSVTAETTPLGPRKRLRINSLGKRTCNNPDKAIPNSNQGASWQSTIQIAEIMVKAGRY